MAEGEGLGASPAGIVAVGGGVFVLWLLLAGTMPTEILIGLAVAIAAGAWARLADL